MVTTALLLKILLLKEAHVREVDSARELDVVLRQGLPLGLVRRRILLGVVHRVTRGFPDTLSDHLNRAALEMRAHLPCEVFRFVH